MLAYRTVNRDPLAAWDRQRCFQQFDGAYFRVERNGKTLNISSRSEQARMVFLPSGVVLTPVNTAVRMTPCMASGITGTIWTMRGLLTTGI